MFLIFASLMVIQMICIWKVLLEPDYDLGIFKLNFMELLQFLKFLIIDNQLLKL